MPAKIQTHIDRALTNISVAYMQDAKDFIADVVFPKIPVTQQSDTYFVYNRDDFFRDEATERADGAESAGGDYAIEQAPVYYCRLYAYHKDVTEKERANSDSPLQPNRDATDFVSQKLLIRKEVLWVNNYFITGVWSRELVGAATTVADASYMYWDNPASTPIQDIRAEYTRMKETTGYKPNTLVLSPYVYNVLADHEDILDRIKYTQRGMVTKEILAGLFDVERVLIAYGTKNTSVRKETPTTTDNEFIAGKHALLLYVEPRPGIKKPSAGYIFTWKGLLGAGAFGNRVVRIPMPWRGMRTERVEAEMAFDMKVVAGDLGTFFKDIIQ